MRNQEIIIYLDSFLNRFKKAGLNVDLYQYLNRLSR